MIKQSTITAAEMRGINRSAILEIIRRESPIARTTIAKRLGISLPTVMRIVDQLVEEGFVRPHGETEWSGGRRRALLEFNSHGNVVLGVDMGGTKLYGALSEISGRIIAESEVDRNGAEGEQIYKLLTALIDELLACPELRGRRVRGIGVGAPGITRHREGIVKWAYALNWKDFPLKERLHKKYRLPITVDNDVNLAALGELWFGAGQNATLLCCMWCDSGGGMASACEHHPETTSPAVAANNDCKVNDNAIVLVRGDAPRTPAGVADAGLFPRLAFTPPVLDRRSGSEHSSRLLLELRPPVLALRI